MQRKAIEHAAAARGEAIEAWYEDTASGGTLKREGLQALRNDVRAGQVRIVWTYRLDRLTRTGIRDTLGLLHEFRGRGAIVRSVADALPDQDSALGEVLVAILSWANQVEREVIRERQTAARARLEAEGRNWGRPRRLTPEKLAWVKRQRKAGRTIADVVSSSGLSESTVRRAWK